MVDSGEAFDRISKFVYYLAGRNCSNQVPLMDFDEVVGELLEEIAKGLKRYSDKPMEELLAILRKMCDNRIAELKYKYCVTHRKEAIVAFPITVIDLGSSEEEKYGGKESPGYSWVMRNATSVADEYDSMVRVTETRWRLSPAARDVFDAVVYGDQNLGVQIELSGMRATNVYKSGGTINIKPWHIANALCMPIGDVKEAYAEIRKAYKEVREEWTN